VTSTDFEISETELKKIVEKLATKINEFYNEKNINFVYFIIILTSSLIFASDIMRELSKLGMVLRTDTIRAKSYKGKKSGEVKIRVDDFLQIDLNEKNILIVDDILDTGETLHHIREQILNIYKPNTLEFCCLLNKIHERRVRDVDVRFIGIDIPDKFVVGYGLDYNGKYRELPYLTTIDQLEKGLSYGKRKK
jgi:hypoxanthine phosphoribosyltransferase